MNKSAEWIFDPVPPSGAIRGGNPVSYVFESDLKTFVREVLQNSHDQKTPGADFVTVDFDLITLTGEHLEMFLSALGWDELSEHLGGAADRANQHAGMISRSLERLQDTGELRLMRITDTGTNGLVGDEDSPGSNYTALVRNVLDTAEDGKSRGGSHGLGKALLWALSAFGVVMFHSEIDDRGERRPRFVGRADLPFHETYDDGRWEGPGWFGDRDPRAERAISFWDAEALEMAMSLHMERNNLDTGTSILVVGFNEPHHDELRSTEEILAEIRQVATESFWPAINRGTLEVRTRLIRNTEEVEAREVLDVESVAAFVEAFDAPVDQKSIAIEVGDTAARHFGLKFPTPVTSSSTSQTGNVMLGLVRKELPEGEEPPLANAIALIRGAGMVVKYLKPRRRPGGPMFYGVLRAGEAVDDSEVSKELEAFLRAAEPPAHNEWHGNTFRMANEYRPGGKAALTRLFQDTESTLIAIGSVDPPSRDDGPERLKKLFSIAKGGQKRPPQRFRTHFGDGALKDSVWTLAARVEQLGKKKPWKAAVQVLWDGESGRGEAIPIATVTLKEGSPARASVSDGMLYLTMPSGVAEVGFSVTTEGLHAGPVGLRTTVRLKVDAEVET